MNLARRGGALASRYRLSSCWHEDDIPATTPAGPNPSPRTRIETSQNVMIHARTAAITSAQDAVSCHSDPGCKQSTTWTLTRLRRPVQELSPLLGKPFAELAKPPTEIKLGEPSTELGKPPPQLIFPRSGSDHRHHREPAREEALHRSHIGQSDVKKASVVSCKSMTG